MTEQTLRDILDRVAVREATAADRQYLKSAITRVHGDRNVVQVGSDNVNLQAGGNLTISNTTYTGAEADTIRETLEKLVDPIGRLRGIPGIVMSIGITTMMLGLGIFGFSLMEGASSGQPPFGGSLFRTGFSIAILGGLVTTLGQMLRGWQRNR